MEWEYFLVDAVAQPQLSHELTELGRQGWEAVGITHTSQHYVVLLKRTKTAAEATAPEPRELEVMLEVPETTRPDTTKG
jgi:hypothetical protein